MELIFGKSAISTKKKEEKKYKYEFPHIILHKRNKDAKKCGFIIELDPQARELLNFNNTVGQTISEAVNEANEVFLTNSTGLELPVKREFSTTGRFSAQQLYLNLCKKFNLNQDVENYLQLELATEITSVVAARIIEPVMMNFIEVTDEVLENIDSMIACNGKDCNSCNEQICKEM